MEFLIPSRGERPSDDPIFALNAEAKARSRAGESILNATVGALLDEEGKLAILPTVAQVVRELPPEAVSGYAQIAGSPEFLRAVVDDLLGSREVARWATAVATPGGTGALRHAVANFVEAGQAVLTTSFFWGPYKTLADEGDRKLATFRMFDEKGGLDTVDFARKLDELLAAQGRALVFLNSPCHNPTGYSFNDAEWNELCEVLAAKADKGPIAMVLDVAYARYGATDLGACVDRVAELAGKVQVMFAWSASKSFTSYGMRVGALVAIEPDPDRRRRIENALSYSCRGIWSNCNAGGMAAIAKVLTDPDLKAKVDRERAGLKGLLDRRVAKWNELAGAAKLSYPRYDGGFFVTVFCEGAPEVAQKLKDEGIFVVPQAGALRVALCSVAEREIPRLVAGIAKHVP